MEFEEYPIDFIENNTKYIFQTLTNKWQTKEGEILELKDMTAKHLFNCKNMMERTCESEGLEPSDYEIYINILRELTRRYEDASFE